MTEKSSKVRELLLTGTKYPEITRQTGAASSTIAYHAKKLGLGKYEFVRKVYDWPAVQAFYDDGYSISEVVEHFGMKWSTVVEARARGDVSMTVRNRCRKIPLTGRSFSDDFVFSEEGTVSPSAVKKRLKEITKYVCVGEECPLESEENPKWAGRPLVLHLDHINGIRDDHRLSNLRWLCPNCHSQTDTYCGRNKGGGSARTRIEDPRI